MAVIAAELVRLREDVGVAVADRVLVSVLAAVPEADGEAVLELDADVDEDDEGELVAVLMRAPPPPQEEGGGYY